MMGNTQPPNLPARASRELALACVACSEGHHEQALVNEQCRCACHGRLAANHEVAA